MHLYILTEAISSFFTDIVLVSVLLVSGIYLSFKTGFVQLRCLKEGLSNMFSGFFRKENKDDISPFAALATSLAAQLGTGNIIGAASAVLTGGPGTVFWIWLSSFFGMATAYCEAFFGQKTKQYREGNIPTGGAAYYIQSCFRKKTGKFLSAIFSLSSVCALGFTGVAVQSNSITASINDNLHISPLLSGIIITIVAAIVIVRGTVFITKLSEKTVPFLAAAYFTVCIGVILVNIRNVPHCFLLILRSAFAPSSLSGAITGLTLKTIISQGIKKGLFTNEAGMGSTAAAHALSNAPSPHYQGTLAIAGVFTDTFVMMTLTAICIITVFFPVNEVLPYGITASEAVCFTFSSVLGEKGAVFFTVISITFFAFSSIIGWSLMGKSSAIFLFEKKSVKIYTVASLLFILAGALFESDTIWQLTDIFNTFMVLSNIPALIKLSREF